MMAPANWLPTNPVVLQDVVESGGAHLVQGAMNWLRDVTGLPDPDVVAEAERFEVGRDVAVTPGKVVMRNRLIELIRYAPQTAQVHPEPVLIVPSWIMKYYILDLSPHNSMVRYLVQQGHTVYMLSWRNPDASDHDLTMDDYLRLGVLERCARSATLHGRAQPVHAMGYCLGGTLLAIAAAALGRSGGVSGVATDLPPLKSLTLLAAQTDFSEPGELGLFIDESQVGYLDEITRGKGYLTGKQMAGSFQFLHSRDLVWTRRMREYLMGEREQRTDLMAWNADTTRMPARMHHEYLIALYLHNALATSSYRVDGPRGVAGRHPTAGVPGRHRTRPHLAVALGLQAAPPVRHRDHLRADQRRPQRRHRLGARPRQPQLPHRLPAGARRLGRARAMAARRRRSTRARGGRPGTSGWPHARRPLQRPSRFRPAAALCDAPGEYVHAALQRLTESTADVSVGFRVRRARR